MAKNHTSDEVVKGLKPIKLSNVKGKWFLQRGKDPYVVEVDAGEELLVNAGCKYGSPSSHFEHPNIAVTKREVYYFRTYFRSGAKRWYAKSGISFYFRIPKSAITLLPIKGYSYIPAEINGVRVQFNVSGGSGNGGWTDWLGSRTSISVGHSLKDLKRLAEVALPGKVELVSRKTADEIARDMKEWECLVAEKTLPAVLAPKIGAVIAFADGLDYCGATQGVLIEVYRQHRTKWRDATPAEKAAHLKEYGYGVDRFGKPDENAPVTGFVLNTTPESQHPTRVRVKLKQINWVKTGLINGLDIFGKPLLTPSQVVAQTVSAGA